MKKRDLTDQEEIKKSIALGEYVCKGKREDDGRSQRGCYKNALKYVFDLELETLYYLRKYRAMRRRYVK